MVSSILCPAVHILGSQNVYGRAEGIADHYWPWAVFFCLYINWWMNDLEGLKRQGLHLHFYQMSTVLWISAFSEWLKLRRQEMKKWISLSAVSANQNEFTWNVFHHKWRHTKRKSNRDDRGDERRRRKRKGRRMRKMERRRRRWKMVRIFESHWPQEKLETTSRANVKAKGAEDEEEEEETRKEIGTGRGEEDREEERRRARKKTNPHKSNDASSCWWLDDDGISLDSFWLPLVDTFRSETDGPMDWRTDIHMDYHVEMLGCIWSA